MSVVLRVQGVGKRYATYPSMVQRVAGWFGLPVRTSGEFWANTDVSFEVETGQALALIGSNGAGKSTLLKMITGTVRPTVGHIDVRGTVSAILELGLGFNPELTGRQNVRQAGAFLGFSPDEIAALMPDIEQFAELGDFFDRPLRVYSSGMQARLAFSLATAKRPDLLIVDEVLSVGDSYFQHKSFDRIRRFKAEGTSILLVTHSLNDARALCDRVIMLEGGRILRDGLPDEIVDYYNAYVSMKEAQRQTVEQDRRQDGWLRTRSGSFDVVLDSLTLLDDRGQSVLKATVGQQLVLRADVEVRSPVDRLVLGLMLRDRSGHVVWGTNTWHTRQIVQRPVVGGRYRFDLAFRCDLGPGSYGVGTALCADDTHLDSNFEWQDNVLVFDVENSSRAFFIGTSALNVEFLIERVS